MKRFLCLLGILSLLCGCTPVPQSSPKQYTATFLNLFDTVTTVVGPGQTQEAFQAQAQAIHDDLEVYHRLFDIYNEYEGLVNLKTLNDGAGGPAMKVDKAILDLLQACKTYYALTQGRVNVAMGSVLSLWHDARGEGLRDPRNARLPQAEQLARAAEHISMDCVILNEAASTVQITDPQLRLDVGAVAKGWATQRVAENAPEGLLISVGGNVCATGPKGENTPWVIGIQDPDGEGNLHTVYLKEGSVVTSGDYQRTYTVGGIAYHHIIDPDTQMPGGEFRSVTVIGPDSALADALSTALFLLPLEEGQALAQQCNVQAFWVDAQGSEYMTPGFEEIMRT